MFTMDKKYNGSTWVGNMFKSFEAACQEVEDFVKKDTVKYVENHMQTVGKNVKQFYSDVVQDILPPNVELIKHKTKSAPSKQIDLVVDIKENTSYSNINKSEEGPLVRAEELHEPSITGLCRLEADADVDIIQQEGDTLVNKTSDKAFQVNLAVVRSPCKDENFIGDPTAKITREEGPLVRAEECHEPSITNLFGSEADVDVDIIQQEDDNMVNKTSDKFFQVNINSDDVNFNGDPTAKIAREEGPLIRAEECLEPSITDLCHSEEDADVALVNTPSDKAFQVNLNSDTRNQENLAVEQSPCKDESFKDDPTAKIALEEGDFVCEPSITDVCRSEADADVDIIQQEGDTLVNKTSDKAFQENLAVELPPCKAESFNDDPTDKIARESSENHLDYNSFEEEKILSNIIMSESDVSVYQNNIVDLNLGINKKIEGHPSEDLNVSVHDIHFTVPLIEEDNVSMETSVVYTENKDECWVGFEPENLNDSLSLPFRNSHSEADAIYCNESLAVPGCDNNNNSNTAGVAFSSYAVSNGKNVRTDEDVSRTGFCRSENDQCWNLARFEASGPCSKIGGEDSSPVRIEELNMEAIDLSDKKQPIESCVIVEDEELYAFSYRSRRSKSYKKIIQDALMSRKRVAKEYKQLAIWYGDIDTEFNEPALSNVDTTPKSSLQDSRDSEWELV